MLELLKKSPPWLRLSLLFPLFIANAWLLFQVLDFLQPLSSLFLAAALFAFLLDIPVRLMVQWGLKRNWAIARPNISRLKQVNENIGEIGKVLFLTIINSA